MSNAPTHNRTAAGDFDAITVRAAQPSDAAELSRIAELDSAALLARPILVAEVDGHLLAAHSLSEGRSVADPFHPTAPIVALLEARASSLGEDTLRGRPIAGPAEWAAQGC